MTENEVYEAVTDFLRRWNRHGWMADNGSANDYMAEGTVDPDDVSEGILPSIVSESWQVWDGRAGWSAHRSGRALVMNWWGAGQGRRHSLDLWVVIDRDFFEAEE